jgi:Na+-transporting methylmalonyl-CoA/oxaloacetate decarboxylase gamma subunit
MQGTLFLLFSVLLGIVLIVLGMSTIFLIPLVVLALAAVFAAPLLALFHDEDRGSPRSDPSGVPSTREASYDPVQEP